MSSILGVGIAALDIINLVTDYPPEDSEIRALEQRICRGGNVTNTLVVLSQCHHQCAWGGVWVDNPYSQPILTDLEKHAIDLRYCQVEITGNMPTSYITLNQRNGSRTIIHYRNLPEFSFASFQKIPLAHFDWLHFEGRNVQETYQMLQYVQQHFPQLTVSLEVEKPRIDIEKLFDKVDVLLFAQEFAKVHGYVNARDFLPAMRHYTTRAQLICAWGTEGGYALDKTDKFYANPAYVPPRVVDTIGAGDTFNAGIIDSLCRGNNLQTALNQACQLAGKKCGQIGLSELNRD
jgi:ketohexokinase